MLICCEFCQGITRIKFAIVVLAMQCALLALSASAHAQAGPVPCASTPDNPGGWCQPTTPQATIPNPPWIPNLFTAFAYSPSTQDYGAAWGQETAAGAKSIALGDCGHRDCGVVAALNSCISFVLADNRIFGLALDRHGTIANRMAYAKCQASGGTNCRVVSVHCAHENE